MRENDMTSARKKLEQMDTGQLDELLNRELERENPDGDRVRTILGILWEREKDLPVEMTPGAKKAWAKYKKNIAKLDSQETATIRIRRWALRAAAVAAMVCLIIFAFPQKAEADSLFEKIANLTGSIVEFFSPGMANDNEKTYIFQTDNPGLQQVYDAVTALGVTDPVVPMWLPEGYELVECKTVETTHKNSVLASFRTADSEIILKCDTYDTDVSHEYHWDGDGIGEYERAGIKHSIMRNNDRWVVIWFTDKTECSLTIDCQEDTLYRILDSIYVMEDE